MKTLTKIGLTGLLVASLGIGAAQARPPGVRGIAPVRAHAPIARRVHVARRAYWGSWFYTPGVSVDFYSPYYAPAPASAVTVDWGYIPESYYAPYAYEYVPAPVYQPLPPAPYGHGYFPRPFRATSFRGVPGPRAAVPRPLPHR